MNTNGQYGYYKNAKGRIILSMANSIAKMNDKGIYSQYNKVDTGNS